MEKTEVIQKIKDKIKKHRDRSNELIAIIDRDTQSENPSRSRIDNSLAYIIASKHEGQADAYTECLTLIEGNL